MNAQRIDATSGTLEPSGTFFPHGSLRARHDPELSGNLVPEGSKVPNPSVARPSRASVARTLERDILTGAIEACRALGIPVDRQNTGMMEIGGRRVRFGRKGNADLTGTISSGPRRGARLALEIKRPGARPTPEQLAHLRAVNDAGGVGFWVSDAADCLRVLQRVQDGAWIELDEAGSQWVVWDEPRTPPDPQLQPPGTTQGGGSSAPADRFSCAKGL